MVQTEYALGVDGGNTKTIALISRLDGTVVGAGQAGCSDIYTNPDPMIPIAQAHAAVSQALTAAGLHAPQLAAGVFSMAGADWPEDFNLLHESMTGRSFGRQILIVNDAVGALRAGSPSGPAVVVACGTGAAIAARSPEGHVWHASFWQDPQGGHHLGMKALRAVYTAELGITPPTLLTEAVLRHFGQQSVQDLLHLHTARSRPHLKEKVSSLSRVLLDIAESGDAVARSIVQGHGEAIGDYALAAARQVCILSVPYSLILTGGVLRHASRLLPEALIARVHATSPQAEHLYSRFEPAVGALLLALETAGVSVDTPLLARLEATLPASTLFAT